MAAVTTWGLLNRKGFRVQGALGTLAIHWDHKRTMVVAMAGPLCRKRTWRKSHARHEQMSPGSSTSMTSDS